MENELDIRQISADSEDRHGKKLSRGNENVRFPEIKKKLSRGNENVRFPEIKILFNSP